MATSASKRKWAILWLDAYVNAGEENQGAQQRLTQLCDEFRPFEQVDDCQQEVQSKSKTLIVLIVSGRLSRDIIPAIEHHERVSAMFIYCMDKSRHEQWIKEHPKVKGVHVKLEELVSDIQSHQNSIPVEVPKPVFHAAPPPGMFPQSKLKKHPLDGYQNVPVFTIDKAAVSLKPCVENIDQVIWMVKQNCEDPPNGLSQSEAAAIMLLTMIWPDKDTCFAAILNKTLATEDPQHILPWLPYVKLVFTALAKVPTIKKIVYRGESSNVSAQYPKDSSKDSWEFSLCTPSIKALEDEETFGKSGPRTLFTIECQTGKDISPYSFEADRQVILLLPGRRLKVVSSLNAGEQLYIVQMLEGEPLLTLE